MLTHRPPWLASDLNARIHRCTSPRAVVESFFFFQLRNFNSRYYLNSILRGPWTFWWPFLKESKLRTILFYLRSLSMLTPTHSQSSFNWKVTLRDLKKNMSLKKIFKGQPRCFPDSLQRSLYRATFPVWTRHRELVCSWQLYEVHDFLGLVSEMICLVLTSSIEPSYNPERRLVGAVNFQVPDCLVWSLWPKGCLGTERNPAVAIKGEDLERHSVEQLEIA